jgi:hypothetical protein
MAYYSVVKDGDLNADKMQRRLGIDLGLLLMSLEYEHSISISTTKLYLLLSHPVTPIAIARSHDPRVE